MPVIAIAAIVVAAVGVGAVAFKQVRAYYLPRALARRVIEAAGEATGNGELHAVVALANDEGAAGGRLGREAADGLAGVTRGAEPMQALRELDALLAELARRTDTWASLVPAKLDLQALSGEDLEALREHLLGREDAGVREQAATGRALRSARRALAELTDARDPHLEDRAVLAGQLSGLGLLAPDTEIVDLSRYEASSGAYDAALVGAVSETVPKLGAEVADVTAAMAEAIPPPPSGERWLETELAQLTSDLIEATTRYVEEIESALSVVHANGALVANARRCIQQAGERMDCGERLKALMRLGETALPVVGEWGPSDAHQAALSATVLALRELTDGYLLALASWARETARTLANGGSAVAGMARSAVGDCLARREQAWESLRYAGEDVILQAAGELAQASERSSGNLPVQAATSLFVVDDYAAARLIAAASELIPAPLPAGAADGEGEEKQDEADSLLRRLHESSLVWAAANVPVLAALDSQGIGGESLAHPLAQLADIPEHLLRAHADLCSYVDTDFVGQAGQTCHELVRSLDTNIVPGISGVLAPHKLVLEHGSYHLVGNFSTVLSAKDTLLGESLLHDGEVVPTALRYLGANVEHAGEYLTHLAKATPQIHDAIGQVDSAAHLAGSAVLHGLLGHLPVVTVALSVSREIKMRQDREIEVVQSVRNVLIDAGPVGAGMGAAAVGGAAIGLHGLALAPVTVPAAALGAVLAKGIRRMRHENAVKKYEQRRLEFEAHCRTMQANYSEAILTAITTQRAALSQALSAPAPLEQAAFSDLRDLTETLRGTLAEYTTKAQALTDAATQVQAARASLDMPLNGVAQRLSEVQEVLASARKDMADGRLAAALMHIGDAAPPLCAWHASHEYEAACTSVARRITALAQTHRDEIGDWIEQTNRLVGSHMSAIDEAVKKAVETRVKRLADAVIPVETARKHAESYA